MSIGTQLTKLRNAKGITRVQLAEELNIPMTTLRNYEQGEREPGHKFLIKAAQYFGVTTDFILENEKSPAPEGAEEDEKIQLVVQGLTSLLENAGWIAPGGDLSDAQLRTLASYVIGLSAYFNGEG